MSSLINSEELERQISACEQEAVDLTRQLTAVTNRLRSLHTIRDTALQLDPAFGLNDAREGEASMNGLGTLTAVGRLVEQRATANSPVTLSFEMPPSGPRKIRSTQMVADLVNSEMREWTREDVHKGFAAAYGNPANWATPANAINNAIARATEKKLFAEREGLYMPWPVYNGQTPVGDPDA
jgi:hypothetical protein